MSSLNTIEAIDTRRSPDVPGQAAGLEAENVSAWFDDHKVLHRVTLEMQANQVTSLIGPSGCGKSTFLRILNRMHELVPSASLAGSVRIDGIDIYRSDLLITDIRRRIGMVFQKPNPFPAMSVAENVVAGLRLAGHRLSRGEAQETVKHCLERAGLWNEVKNRLGDAGGGLSGGQQQRLCIARALAVKPDVLLMDEPCSALDPTSTRRIEETIDELREQVTIVIVTHNMQQAARVSQYCRVLPRGRRRARSRRGAGHHAADVLPSRGPTDARLCDGTVRIMRRFARLGLLCLIASVLVPLVAQPAFADVSIDGAGSTWVQIALQQWAADVARQGLSINYQGVGSTSGRVFYYQDQVDFAASEIPFTSAYRDATGSVVTNEVSLAAHRPYAYMPDVAGGTSFMYHLTINGQLVTSLRLTPEEITKIFTGVITNWNDPAIAKDNPQLQLPNLPIRTVVRSDGSGTTAQFTAFMAAKEPALYNAYCQKVGLTINPCPSVSLWPDINAVSQQLSDGVADYVAAPYNNGAITYVEYGYAKQRGYPVASVLNNAGYFTQPTPGNVAVALTKATLNADLTQNLGGVYNNPDPRTYPVSSYSYLIVPTKVVAPFTAAKGTTLSKFILYLACAGQQEAAQLGYSPLPQNLVQDVFNVVLKIPGHVNPPAINQCDNPTILNGGLDKTDPVPTFDQKQGSTPPPAQTTNPPSGNGVITGPQIAPTVTTPALGGSGATRGGKAPGAGKAGAGKGGVNEVAAGPLATQPAAQVYAVSGPVQVPPARDPLPLLLYVVAAVAALVALFGPPALTLYLRKPKT